MSGFSPLFVYMKEGMFSRRKKKKGSVEGKNSEIHSIYHLCQIVLRAG